LTAPGANTPGVTKALQLLQFLYNAMPSQLRLILAQAVCEWAERAKAQALAELAGGPQSPPQQAHDFTTEGHSRPY
jgi:hypothetical protein